MTVLVQVTAQWKMDIIADIASYMAIKLRSYEVTNSSNYLNIAIHPI